MSTNDYRAGFENPKPGSLTTKAEARKQARNLLAENLERVRPGLQSAFEAYLSGSSGNMRFLASIAIAGELDVMPSLLNKNADVFLPVTLSETEMAFYQYTSQGRPVCSLKPGKFSIPEPARQIPYEPLPGDIMIVPCLAVNKNGYRLGRGKGYYDRQYKQLFDLKRIAVLPDCVSKMGFHGESHDLRLNTIITEERIVEVREDG